MYSTINNKKQMKAKYECINNTGLFCFNYYRKGNKMGDILLYTLSLILIGIMFYLSYRAIKKAESLAEKITELIMAMVMFIFLIIYYSDRYDIPSKLNMTMNINAQNWLSFIGNYVSAVISAIIGALVAVWSAIYQIKKNNEENNRRDKENLKIQNMPILKYDINTEIKGTGDLSELIVTNKENEVGNAYNLNIILKNIGMNSIKNIIIDFRSLVINNSIYRLLGKNAVNPIEKGEIVELNKYFSLKSSNNYYEMYLDIYYQDVLSNWYKQEIQIHYTASRNFNNEGYSGRLTYEVQKEIEISENEIEKNVI